MNENFPEISASNLNGRKLLLPRDFMGRVNIVVIAFKREHQTLVDDWIPFLNDLVEKYPGFDYYELPTIAFAYSMIRWLIDGGMRAGITDSNVRERTITLYVNKEKIKQELEILSEDTIFIFLIRRGGEILWRSNDGPSDKKRFEIEEIVKREILKI